MLVILDDWLDRQLTLSDQTFTSIADALASDDGHQMNYGYLQIAADANEKFLEDFGHIEGM